MKWSRTEDQNEGTIRYRRYGKTRASKTVSHVAADLEFHALVNGKPVEGQREFRG